MYIFCFCFHSLSLIFSGLMQTGYNFRNFLVFVGFLLASFDRGLFQWCVLVNQSVEMDCEEHVVPPVKFLEPYDSNQSTASSLTLRENDAVHVQSTSGTSSSNREEERP